MLFLLEIGRNLLLMSAREDNGCKKFLMLPKSLLHAHSGFVRFQQQLLRQLVNANG